MGFKCSDSQGRGGFARIFKVEDKGKYAQVSLATSKKKQNAEGDAITYETDFQDGFVRFIGAAYEEVMKLKIGEKGTTIQITSCEVTNHYDPTKKVTYTNYCVYSFVVPEQNGRGNSNVSAKTASSPAKKEVEPEPDEELPF